MKSYYVTDPYIMKTSRERVKIAMTKEEGYFAKMKEAMEKIESKAGIGSISELSAGILKYKKLLDTFYQESMEERMDHCLKNGDMQAFNNLLFEDFRWSVLPGKEDGYDHCGLFYEALGALACGDNQAVERLLPFECGLSANGYPFYLTGTNVLMALWYNTGLNHNSGETSGQRAAGSVELHDKFDRVWEVVQKKADKFAASKKPQFERMVVKYLLALHEKELTVLEECLQTICESYARTDFSKYRNKYCIPAVGLLSLTYYLYPDIGSVKLPEYKNFPTEYALWRQEHREPELKLFDSFPKELEIIGRLLTARPARTYIWQPHLMEDNPYLSAQDKKKWVIDQERMKKEFLEYFLQTEYK